MIFLVKGFNDHILQQVIGAGSMGFTHINDLVSVELFNQLIEITELCDGESGWAFAHGHPDAWGSLTNIFF